MKYIFSLFIILFAFCILSIQAQTHESEPDLVSDNQFVSPVCDSAKVKFYKGNFEFIDRLRQDTVGQGRVKVFQDYRIDDLLKIDRVESSVSPGFEGYRIQIFSGGGRDKDKAFFIREDLKELFPEERVYVKYQAPDFRVRIGNFRSKFEAMHLYKQCVKKYPYCYLVKDQIKFADLEAEEMIEEIE